MMKLIPAKSSTNLLKIMGYYSAALYVVLLICHAILKSGFTLRSLSGMASLAIISALVAGLGYWLEGRLFFAIFSTSLGAGVLYMLYIAIFNATPGWGDVTSIIGYMLVAAMGMIIGLAAEYVRYLLKTGLKPKIKPE
jgi:hypothetical protein